MVAGADQAAKLSITPSGVLLINNTFVGEHQDMSIASNIHFINNLFVSHGGQGAKRGFGLITYTNYSTSDYNGFYFRSRDLHALHDAERHGRFCRCGARYRRLRARERAAALRPQELNTPSTATSSDS